jgi:hypothetical protein
MKQFSSKLVLYIVFHRIADAGIHVQDPFCLLQDRAEIFSASGSIN